MLGIVLTALIISFAVYLFIGFWLGRNTRSVADMLPLMSGKQASVKNAGEFSDSTVATTISLATVVVAFFELAPYFGVWLFWCVLTTAAGILVVRVAAPKIWHRLSLYEKRPSLHEFLGEEFGSKPLAVVGAVCTTLGFLGAFAVELTVGSRFLSGLIQSYPQWAVVMVLSTVAFVYTSFGGFRAVVVTDRLQMGAIWLLLLALSVFVGSTMIGNGSWQANMELIPADVKHFTWRAGLGAFLVGIFIINMLSYLADMSVWQRIAASESPSTVLKGLGRSVSMAAITWTVLVALACLSYVVAKPVAGENPLLTLLATAGLKAGLLGKVVLFCVVLGLFGAMLSTASTQLIAVSHTVYEDLLGRLRNISLADRIAASGKELLFSRVILIYAALLAMILVEWLAYLGFSVADMVFAVYGAQLALLPPILLALWLPREQLRPLATWAHWAIGLGFFSGWASEIIGKLTDNHLAFSSPIISVSISLLLMTMGFVSKRLGGKKR